VRSVQRVSAVPDNVHTSEVVSHPFTSQSPVTSKLESYSRSVDNTPHKNVRIIFGRGIPVVLFKYISKLNKSAYSWDRAFLVYKHYCFIYQRIKPFRDEEQTALFKDPVRTAQ
jgi:hypothetical protein